MKKHFSLMGTYPSKATAWSVASRHFKSDRKVRAVEVRKKGKVFAVFEDKSMF